jgi:hypothetical protein
VNEAHKDLPNKGKSFFFRELLAFLEEVLEISFVAELSDDVAVIGGAENIVAFKDVRVVEFLESVNLTF